MEQRQTANGQGACLLPGRPPPPSMSLQEAALRCGYDARFSFDVQTEHRHDVYRLIVDAFPPPLAIAVARSAMGILDDSLSLIIPCRATDGEVADADDCSTEE